MAEFQQSQTAAELIWSREQRDVWREDAANHCIVEQNVERQICHRAELAAEVNDDPMQMHLQVARC